MSHKQSYTPPQLTTYGRVEDLTQTGCWDINGDGLGKSLNKAEDSQFAFLGHFGLGDCS